MLITKENEKEIKTVEFEVDSGTTLVEINFSYDTSEGANCVDFALKSEDEFLGATGGEYKKIILANDNRTTPGYPKGLRKKYSCLFKIYRASNDFELLIGIKQIKEEKKPIKVDLHSHTFCSDGKYSINDVDGIAQNRGIDVVAITDHNSMVSSRFLSDSTATTFVNGFELTTDYGHMNIFGLENADIKYGFTSKEELVDYIQRIKQNENVFQIVNHPFATCDKCNWELDYDYDALEVFNSLDVDNNIATLNLWQQFLEKGKYIPGTCGSDTHKLGWFKDGSGSHGIPCNVVSSTDKSMKNILRAIRNFDNTITYFPNENIHIELVDNRINVITDIETDIVKVFTECGEVDGQNFVYSKFYRVEIWRETKYLQEYILRELGSVPNWDYKYVPIYSTNPIFMEEV